MNEIIEYLQSEAAKRGYVPQVYLNMVENVKNTYLAFSSQMVITRDGDIYTTEEARNQLGLQPVPQLRDVEKFKKVLEEVVYTE